MTDPRVPTSSLPDNIVERTVSPYRREEYDNGGSGVWLRVAECVLDGVVIAKREYDEEDRLTHEIPLDDQGRRHGLVLEWHENGQLDLAEPYVAGLIDGTATQWDEDGTLLGSYTLKQGTGFDIWRQLREDGTIVVTEVHSLREGQLDGYEWWFDDDQRLWWERQIHRGQLHGIEREWTKRWWRSRCDTKYWINDVEVDKRRYIRAAASDPSLAPFVAADQKPARSFPDEIQRALEGEGK